MPTMSSAEAFKEAFAQRAFRVVYQPVVDIRTGHIFSYEVLLRSLTPTFSTPPAMINAAVACGCMGQFGRVLRELSVQNAPPTPLFINIHPAELGEGWIVRPDDPIFEYEHGIYLEITESVPLTHFELCGGILREVRHRGIFLAVDDLGAGYSNLKYISDLAPEIVKLDRELIMNLHTSKRQQILVRSLVQLCGDLGAEVVAEGIETRDELNAVIDTGAKYGQGYLLARPEYPPPTVRWPPIQDA